MPRISGNITRAEEGRIRVLNGQGYTDPEIGDKLGRSEHAIQRKRSALGIPALPQNCRERVRKMHEKGMLDRQIAEKLSKYRPISPVVVSSIRRNLGKKCHKFSKPGSWRREHDGITIGARYSMRLSDEKEREWTRLMAGRRFQDYRLK